MFPVCVPYPISGMFEAAAVVVVYGSGGQLVRLCLGLVLAYLSNSLLALAVPSLSGCKLGKGREELGIGKVEGKVKKAEKE